MSQTRPAGATGSRRCLVTGAAGFIGSHLSEALLAEGHEVVGLDCFTDYYDPAVKRANLEPALAHERYELAELDLRRDDLAAAVECVDAVFHLAAMPGLLRSWTDFDGYMTCNVQGTQRLLEALRQAGGAHLVHVSTSSVYGRDSSGAEDRPLAPISPYGVTKLAAEKLVLAYAEIFELPVTVLRYFSIYGPRQRPDMGYHIFIERILDGEPITVFGDGRQSRGNTYIDDCVSATVAAMHRGPTGEVYNVGGGEVVSVIDVLRTIEAITGRRARIEHGPARPGEQLQALADTGKARAAFDWSPRTGVEEGLRAQVAWQLARRDARSAG